MKTFTFELASVLSFGESKLNNKDNERINILKVEMNKNLFIEDSYDNQWYILKTNNTKYFENLLKNRLRKKNMIFYIIH